MELIPQQKLSHYYQQIDLIQATANQIKKDFSLFEENIEFSGDAATAYNELFNQILPIINRLLNLDSSRFFSLLYAIDIEEKKIRELLFGDEVVAAIEKITALIIDRELLKVIYRKHWLQNQKSAP